MKFWPYPLPSSEVWELCDPNKDSDFHQPFELDEGMNGISNGFLAIKLQTFLENVVTSPNAELRFLKLPWQFFNYPEREEILPIARENWEKDWVDLDQRASAIKSKGNFDAWEPGPDKSKAFVPIHSPCLAVGHNQSLIPLSILQLLLKLPRCQIYPKHHSQEKWFFFRFNGGTGITATLSPEKNKPLFSIWKPDLSKQFTGTLFA